MEAFKAFMQNDEVILLDTRRSEIFARVLYPGVFLLASKDALPNGPEASCLSKKHSAGDRTRERKETVVRLARVGFQQFAGYLKGGFEAWQKAKEPVDMIIEVEADELAMDLPFDPQLVVVDVRREPEFAEGHVKGAVNMPLKQFNRSRKHGRYR